MERKTAKEGDFARRYRTGGILCCNVRFKSELTDILTKRYC